MDLSDRVLGPSPWSEPIRTRPKIDLVDGFKHQLRRCLHHTVAYGRDTQPASLPRPWLGDHPLPYRLRFERAGLQVGSQIVQELLNPAPDLDVASCLAVNSGTAGTLVCPDATPCHDKERRITYEVI